MRCDLRAGEEIVVKLVAVAGSDGAAEDFVEILVLSGVVVARFEEPQALEAGSSGGLMIIVHNGGIKVFLKYEVDLVDSIRARDVRTVDHCVEDAVDKVGIPSIVNTNNVGDARGNEVAPFTDLVAGVTASMVEAL